jgi:hypothetical protein
MDLSTSQGRFFILDSPVVSPGVCGICGFGGAEGRKYLDPRLDFEFYGSLIFCEDCVTAMANQFGCLNPAQAQALESRVEEAERQLITYRAVISNMENVSVAVSSLVASGVLSSDGNLVAVSPSDAAIIPETAVSDEGSAEREDAEPVDEPRSDDLRNTDAADDFINSLGI